MKRGRKKRKVLNDSHNALLYSLIIFVVLISGSVLVNSSWVDSEHPVYHLASDIKVVTSTGDDTLQNVITNLLGSLGNQNSTWQKDEKTKEIYYTDANVGIGTANPNSKLDVAGSINGDELYLGDGKMWFNDANQLCYKTDLSETCDISTEVCSVDSIRLKVSIWDCSKDNDYLQDACDAYCTGESQNLDWWQIRGFKGTKYPPTPAGVVCVGDAGYCEEGTCLKDGTSCTEGNNVRWNLGFLYSCNTEGVQELTCQCSLTSAQNYNKEIMVPTGGETCF